MTELRFEELWLPAADLGPENPLPRLATPADPHATPAMHNEELPYIGYGAVSSCLPYTVQDGYTRERALRPTRVAVLENDILHATFLLERGGRLYALRHKPTGRELLEVNPVFQPANLAVRNAWFSGGVEWNIGVIGHCPFTCSPLFAARIAGADGMPMLRMYEWERIRGVPFQLDIALPPGSPLLFVRVSITNPHPHEVPMYWWSNIAVTETPDLRVLAPADSAFHFGYGGDMPRIGFPGWESYDASYPATLPQAMDFFFCTFDGHRPWIAALDREGRGLVQTSTARLKGRKLFVWGTGAGGRHWQEFLSQPGHAYCEIQAGLAYTQAEHLPMPAGAEWSWLEAYGLLEADAAAVHGTDWARAQQAVEEPLNILISRETLDAEFARLAPVAAQPPVEIVQHGSGWGALECRRRKAAGEPPCNPPSMVFGDDTLGDAQRPWLALLDTGCLPTADPADAPASFMVQPQWRQLLEASVLQPAGDHWLAWLHLGIMRYHSGDTAGARAAWERSQALTPSSWALRNLSIIARDDERWTDAAALLDDALALRSDLQPLAVECAAALLKAGQPERWLAWLDRLPVSLRTAGRLVALEAQAALATGDLERVERIFADPPTVTDLQEGELSLSDLWFSLQEQKLSRAERRPVDDELRAHVRRTCPPPYAIDFRMAREEE